MNDTIMIFGSRCSTPRWNLRSGVFLIIFIWLLRQNQRVSLDVSVKENWAESTLSMPESSSLDKVVMRNVHGTTPLLESFDKELRNKSMIVVRDDREKAVGQGMPPSLDKNSRNESMPIRDPERTVVERTPPSLDKNSRNESNVIHGLESLDKDLRNESMPVRDDPEKTISYGMPPSLENDLLNETMPVRNDTERTVVEGTPPSLDKDLLNETMPVRDDEKNVGISTHNIWQNLSGATDPRIALFYNAYWNPKNTSLADAIIAEQMEQRKGKSVLFVDNDELASDAVMIKEDNQQNGAPDAILYYYSLGAPNHTTPSCDPCHHLGHKTNASEQITLQEMYEYCLRRPQDTVVYFHNKGSFTSNSMNNRLRRQLTKAVFSKECLSIHNTTYDMCAATFTGFPFAHIPGNFFTANCNYVNRLIPPRDFERVRRGVHESMLQNKSLPWASDTDAKMSRESWLGLGRYAMEHWIGSHPSLRPAMVYNLSLGPVTYKWVNKDLSWVPELRSNVKRAGQKMMKKAPEFYRRSGRLYLYEKLYGELPPPGSWVWDFYVA